MTWGPEGVLESHPVPMRETLPAAKRLCDAKRARRMDKAGKPASDSQAVATFVAGSAVRSGITEYGETTGAICQKGCD